MHHCSQKKVLLINAHEVLFVFGKLFHEHSSQIKDESDKLRLLSQHEPDMVIVFGHGVGPVVVYQLEHFGRDVLEKSQSFERGCRRPELIHSHGVVLQSAKRHPSKEAIGKVWIDPPN